MTQKQTHVHASLIKITGARTKSDCCHHVIQLAWDSSIYPSICQCKPRRAAFRFPRTVFGPHARGWRCGWMRRKTGCLWEVRRIQAAILRWCLRRAGG
jgi:hypothetical protein